jgi:hypothetical protein
LSLHVHGSEGSEQLVGRLPIEGLARTPVELFADSLEVVDRVETEVRALREVVTERAIGVLVARSLPWASGVAENTGIRTASATVWWWLISLP